MFERFTERARQVLVLAQDEARKFESEQVGPAHLLLGVLMEEEGVGARILREDNITEDTIRDLISFGDAGKSIDRVIGFNEEAKKSLELSLREALSLGHNYIGTGHILLALVRQGVTGFRFASDTRDRVLHMIAWTQMQPKEKPFTVTFQIKPGELWVDSNRVVWTVKAVSANRHGVQLERVVSKSVLPETFIREYSKSVDSS